MTASKPLRIGIFGGAFDPPHTAHVAVAGAAVAQLQLDQLRIIPTGFAWHKARALTAASHRLAMCELAFGGLRNVVVDARETLRSGPTYTADTLRELQHEYAQAQLFLIIGEDQARALHTWQKLAEVLQAAIICVAERPDIKRHGASSTDDTLQFPGLRTAPIALQMQSQSVSATDIRERVAHHLNVTPLVFDSVARYIDQHHLYQSA